ncbi:MAG: flagellar hook protein FlgE [Pseudomonadota bacterium]|jgi:flagellar hook protein FlgE
MSIRTAIGGLNAAQTDLSTTANNIANASTTGFKSSRTEFADLFTAGSAGVEPGAGVRVAGVVQNFSQGDLAATGNSLDLGVNGNGFFMVRTGDGSNAYTRAGAFQLDREGFLANGSGDRLQTYKYVDGRFETGVPTTLQVARTSPAQATSNVELAFNLPASGATQPAVAFDPTRPESYNFSSATTVYDSQGGAHVATVYLVKQAAENTWKQYLYIGGSGTGNNVQATGTGATGAGTVADPYATTLTFDGNGVITQPTLTAPTSGKVAYSAYDPTTTGANPITLSIDLASTTQLGRAFNVSSVDQNGYSSGSFIGLSVDNQGVIRGSYTNGREIELGKVALANFAVPRALNVRGNSTWTETFGSGAALLGSAGSGGLGEIRSGVLESSNVDITEQLVNMITAQRNFQANAKVVSTADQLAQSIINLR